MNISGTLFYDANGDGTQDNGELGIGGVTINLAGTVTEVSMSTVTASDGSYSFTGLAADTYTVSQPLNTGIYDAETAAASVVVTNANMTANFPYIQGVAYLQISRLTEAAAWPALTDIDLADLVKRSKREDKYRRAPADPLWLPTYNLDYAIAQGWEIKAGRVATAVDFEDAVMKVSRSQVRTACIDQAKVYRNRITGAVQLLGPQRPAMRPVPAQTWPIPILPTEAQQENV